MEAEVFIRGLVVATAVVSTAYVFAKTLDVTKSFSKALLAVSALVDFYLIVMWILGIDRTIAILEFKRLGTSIQITALTLFIPLKLAFTIYLWTKTKGAQT